jgi:uncharacterized protein YjbI with pentapeptide repeats
VNEARKTVATVLGGFVVLLGAYFTWRNISIAQEGQVTDRFTRAIEQLGAVHLDGRSRIEVRLGGIYALSRMARQNQGEWPIVEVFCAYVRQNSPRVPTTESTEHPDSTLKPKPDIEAILRFLSSFAPPDRGVLDLSHVDLRNAKLPKATFRRVDLSHSDLSGAELKYADMGNAKLTGAKLDFAVFENANLRHATLVKASMYAAKLGWADLTDADLLEAELNSTYLGAAHLTRAKLSWAELNKTFLGGADLSEAHLEGATLNDVDLGSANLTNAILSGAQVGAVKSANTILQRTDLSDVDLTLSRELTALRNSFKRQ